MLKLTNGSFENNWFFGLNVSHLNSIRMTPCLMERIMGMDVEVVLWDCRNVGSGLLEYSQEYGINVPPYWAMRSSCDGWKIARPMPSSCNNMKQLQLAPSNNHFPKIALAQNESNLPSSSLGTSSHSFKSSCWICPRHVVCTRR